MHRQHSQPSVLSDLFLNIWSNMIMFFHAIGKVHNYNFIAYSISTFLQHTLYLPIYTFVFFSEIFIEITIQNRICQSVTQPKQMEQGIYHRFISLNQRLHFVWINIHKKIKQIQRKPRYKEYHSNAYYHNVCSFSFFIVFCMLTLK